MSSTATATATATRKGKGKGTDDAPRVKASAAVESTKRLSDRGQSAVDAFTTAQRAYVAATVNAHDAETARVEAFIASAIRASEARTARVTLQHLADANKAALADLIETAPKGTLYVSLAGVTYHSITGDALRLPDAPAPVDGETVAVLDPFDLQVKIGRAAKVKAENGGVGVKAIGEGIRKCKTRQDALAYVVALLDAAKMTDGAGSAGSDDDDAPATVADGPAVVTMEAALSAIVDRIESGEYVSDESRAIIGALFDMTAVAVVVQTSDVTPIRAELVAAAG